MRSVSAQELESWIAEGRILEQDTRGPKVVMLQNARYLKIFHTRRHPAIARLRPAARRFQRNTIRLQHLGISAPEVLDVFWLDAKSGVSGCIYSPLAGEPVESINKREPERIRRLLPSLAAFIKTLHANGIYFRSLHLGNILELGNEQFGLIDVLDMRFKHAPLGQRLVNRNFAHLSQYLARHQVLNFPMDALVDHYHSLD